MEELGQGGYESRATCGTCRHGNKCHSCPVDYLGRGLSGFPPLPNPASFPHFLATELPALNLSKGQEIQFVKNDRLNFPI